MRPYQFGVRMLDRSRVFLDNVIDSPNFDAEGNLAFRGSVGKTESRLEKTSWHWLVDFPAPTRPYALAINPDELFLQTNVLDLESRQLDPPSVPAYYFTLSERRGQKAHQREGAG